MTTLSEVYRNAPMTSYQITPLDFDSLDEIQTQEPQELSIPIIDPNALDLIGQASKTWGIFQVINHGVPLALIKKLESESRRLFALPTDEKHKVLRSANAVTGYGTARISPFFDKCMWHEGFAIMGSCVEDAKALWPHDYKNFW
ncbi:oxoglutarate/iron-dependent dioxygenase [Artemisia annua]|uniref:Oxoglutarate/iron-dependent dioxygenase n=1 Tax=Artemisia annua TaxID=35608 RepID=A0A2U1N5A3_ARTAN|nr:oxoglutarate/iron-dependent dioxygenase [Artemisia annua]